MALKDGSGSIGVVIGPRRLYSAPHEALFGEASGSCAMTTRVIGESLTIAVAASGLAVTTTNEALSYI